MENVKRNAALDLKESFKRVSILVSMQLKNVNKKKSLSFGRKTVSFFVSLVLIALITTGLYFALSFIVNVFSIGFILSSDFLMVYIAALQLTSIVTCTGGMMQSLFLDRDNVLLLSFPCRHSEVFTSKLIVYYIFELRKALFGILPLILTIGISTNESIYSALPFVKLNYFLLIPIVIILLPLIPVLIGSLLSLPASFLKRFINSSPIIELIFILVLVFLTYGLTFIIVSALPDRIAVITEYVTFLDNIKSLFASVASFTLYVRFFVHMLYSYNILLNILFILLIVVTGVTLVILIIKPFYFNLASRSMEEAREKDHKMSTKTNKNVFVSFIKKEFLMSYRDIGKTTESYLLILFMPSIMILILAIYSRLALNLSTGPVYASIFAMLYLSLLSLTSVVDISTSLSREGTEFIILKTAPSKCENVTWAKILVSLVFTLGVLTVSYLMLYVGALALNIKYLVEYIPLIYVVSVITNIGLTFKGMEVDVMNPSLIEYATTKSTKENKNISKTIEEGTLLSVIYTTIFGIFIFSVGLSAFLVLIPLSIIYLVYRVFSFRTKLFAFFDDIEV
ncbi:hypothetical protein IKQ02_05160 [bacterium]|nr:hypothetical protein [bacterium]